MKTMAKVLGAFVCLVAAQQAWATCLPADPLNVENDCDLDGCKVGQGDCNDSPDGGVFSRGASCPNGAVTETCDGRDNNCTGGPDEGNPGGGVACTTALPGVCMPGIRQCQSGVLNCVQNVMSSAETCDNLDNNCNGNTDESLTRFCFSGPANTFNGACPGPTCVPKGACVRGNQTCSAGSYGTSCPGEVLPVAETCNNIDDDCNGTTDNGVSQFCFTGPANTYTGTCPGPTCTPRGVCVRGTSTCAAGSFGTCTGQTLPGTESCNNLDDDCDGQTDETVTQICFTGGAGTFTGTCPGPTCVPRGACVAGVSTCAAGAFGTCSGQTLPVTETCNNVDDNCNGTTDEGLAVDLDGDGVRACGSCGAPAAPNCDCNDNSNAVKPGLPETCDNLDNNCNGTTDESITQFCFTGGAGTFTGTCPGATCAPRGTCVRGTQTCSAGTFGTCSGQTLPVTEVCDGLDNNCDGTTDNGIATVGTSCPTGQSGICSAGTWTCNNSGGWGVRCVRNVNPGTETCNNLDDNCDGTTDNGIATTSCNVGGQSGVCRTGTSTCSSGTAGCMQTVFPSTESCNNLDDNCDGTTDNNIPDAGSACSTGQSGICAAGTLTCNNMGGFALRCVRNMAPATETCDNLDNNCNGQTDDGVSRFCYTGPANTYTGTCPGTSCAPRGACRRGTETCSAGAFSGTCTGQTLPGTETCNNIDDDCDGTTDNGFGVGGACTTTNLGRCTPGTTQCLGNGSSTCVSTIAPGSLTEICNNLDDDCDGQTDEGIASTSCTVTTAQGVCRNGTNVCSGGTTTCTQTVNPSTEICDGLDNNCDGMVDNGIATVGTTCTTGQQGVCSAGTQTCNNMGGWAVRCVQNMMSSAETCDNLDNNCNGTTDESLSRFCFEGDAGTFTGTCPGTTCTPRGACVRGNSVCASGVWGSCTGQTLPGTETCNNQDDNCNGTTDEGLITDMDTDGVRKCGTCFALDAGLCDCDDTNNNVRPGRQEICNGLDDNCNFQIDEGAGAGGKISRNCYSGMPPSTASVGLCVEGVQTCNSPADSGIASYTACMSEVIPQTETCDTFDNDCDGQTDEGFDSDNDGFVSCALCSNRMNCDCNDNDATIKPGAAEQCDTVDSNCDGRLDDVPARTCFAGQFVTPTTYTNTCPGSMCTPKGECRAGTQMCQTAGGWGACVGQVLPTNDPAQDETTCDSKDNDCDGTTDDGNFDVDMDGVRSCQGDCNDTDPAIKPGALEICDAKDNNCDGTTDGTNTGCYSGPMGTEGKGRCVAGMAVCANGMPSGTCSGEILPATETCNSIDDDCDGKTDEDFDGDGDGVVSCALCPGIMPCDCDDADKFNKPGAAEICDCKDNNCNTTIDEGGVCVGAPCHDFDGDGYTNCQGDCNDTPGAGGAIGPFRSEVFGNMVDDDCDGAVDENTDEDRDGFTTAQGDCDDRFASIRPDAVELCDGFDNNCNGRVDEGFDVDGDFATSCAGDCDDNDSSRSPFRNEVCNNAKDDNCNGRVDEDTDDDGDGVTTCEGDCNDYQATVHPTDGTIAAAAEICDGQDNDCDFATDEGFDTDNDGYATCFGDCNDTNNAVNPSQYEVPGNSIDDNCNGQTDEGALDSDGDGYAPICGDCNDRDPAIHPHATEVCDRVDNNCDSFVDSAPGNYALCAVCFDADGDGVTGCDGDCNDSDRDVYRGAIEICDGKDNDCDFDVDLDPATGLRVCRNDGGVDDGGTTEDAGTEVDAGSDTDAGQMTEDDGGTTNMPGQRPIVSTGCGCQSTDGALPLLALIGLWAMRRRRSAFNSTSAALLSVVLLMACPSQLKSPLDEASDGGGSLDDGGMQTDDGGSITGDGGVEDAGTFKPPNPVWECPEHFPVEHLPVVVPGTDHAFARSRSFELVEKTAQQMLILDNNAKDLAGFILRRELPADIDINAPGALETVAAREVAALDTLQGMPGVSDRVERFSRVINDTSTQQQTFTSAQTLTFATRTNAFALRNRLLSSLSQRSPATLEPLPQPAMATAQDSLVVYLMFRLTQQGLFIGAAVTPLDKFRDNQPALNDLTNGSHLSAPRPTLNYACEKHTAPAIKTDFIFVVDSSGSMIEEQAALSDAAAGLFDAFQRSGLDFRIGVVTTDSDVLRGAGFTNVLSQFKSDVKVGINGNSFEMGVEYGLRAIRRARLQTAPAFKLRDDAGLVVVFISDEENAGLKPIQDYVADYNTEKAVAFAIVGPRPTGCARVGLGRAKAGTEYLDLATKTGGSGGSICNPNLTEVIEEVLFGAQGASSRATLTLRPISGSLAVRTTMPLARTRVNGFDYDPATNTILFFGSLPSEGANFDSAFAYFEYIQ